MLEAEPSCGTKWTVIIGSKSVDFHVYLSTPSIDPGGFDGDRKYFAIFSYRPSQILYAGPVYLHFSRTASAKNDDINTLGNGAVLVLTIREPHSLGSPGERGHRLVNTVLASIV